MKLNKRYIRNIRENLSFYIAATVLTIVTLLLYFLYKKPVELGPYKVITVDASVIVPKGAVKKTWHLHYGVNLFSLTCNQFKLTEQSTGESLKNFEIKEKDLIIADRAYGTITSMEHCLNSGGDFIIRIKNKPFNLYNLVAPKELCR